MQTMLDDQEFAAWLASKAGRLVGRACSCEGCPLASFLNERLGGVWGVAGETFYESASGQWGNLPQWASAFVSALDRAYGSVGWVSGEMARVVLAQVRQEMGF